MNPRRMRLLLLAAAVLLPGCTVPMYGLGPEYPKAGRVDSVRPTLRWESFPTGDDWPGNPELLSLAQNVTYDLKIFRSERDGPGPLVYSRRGLPQPSHTLEAPLEPATNYFWTVRARFELDGRTRVTPWARVAVPGPTIFQVPSPFYFRFGTPSE